MAGFSIVLQNWWNEPVGFPCQWILKAIQFWLNNYFLIAFSSLRNKLHKMPLTVIVFVIRPKTYFWIILLWTTFLNIFVHQQPNVHLNFNELSFVLSILFGLFLCTSGKPSFDDGWCNKKTHIYIYLYLHLDIFS